MQVANEKTQITQTSTQEEVRWIVQGEAVPEVKIAAAAAPLTCLAAVLWSRNKLTIETVSVAPPQKREVRVKVMNAGVCQTDSAALTGQDDAVQFPCILGQEGAGIVESIGEDVTSVAVGDHVILLSLPECKECRLCLSGKTNLCEKASGNQARGLMPDGATRFTCNGKEIMHYKGTSSFSQYTVLMDISVVKINSEAAFARACLLGSLVPCSMGAVWNVAKVEKGATVAVFGLAAIGMAVVSAAATAGASRIIGVDPSSERLELAKKFGLTDAVDPSSLKKNEMLKAICDLVDGGVDYVFDCTPDIATLEAAFQASHAGWGLTVVIALPRSSKAITLHPTELGSGRTIRGTTFGGYKGSDIPALVEMYLANKLNLEELITSTMNLKEINEAFNSILHNTHSIHSVLNMW
jgi:S-(hydroxymethyl)glutathione dehydrogenase/alcohol dehydrogenase